MKLILGFVGLAAVAIALEHRVNPPQPTVLIDAPAPAVPDPARAPAHDLELNNG